MVSAIEVLPARSMVTVSSAFMSSMRARTRRRVSLASGRTLATFSGARRAPARESVDEGRGPFLSFGKCHAQHRHGGLTVSTSGGCAILILCDFCVWAMTVAPPRTTCPRLSRQFLAGRPQGSRGQRRFEAVEVD